MRRKSEHETKGAVDLFGRTFIGTQIAPECVTTPDRNAFGQLLLADEPAAGREYHELLASTDIG